MSALSGRGIKKYLERDLVIMPFFDYSRLEKSNTLDLRLGCEFIVMRKGELAALIFSRLNTEDDRKKLETDIGRFYERIYVSPGHHFVLHPGELVLGITLEYVYLPRNLMLYVIGRSSWGRLGLIIATATVVHPGFKGCITLELVNHGNIPVQLYPGFPIAQVSFHELDQPQDAYKGKYGGGWVGPTSPEPSKIHTEQEELTKWIP